MGTLKKELTIKGNGLMKNQECTVVIKPSTSGKIKFYLGDDGIGDDYNSASMYVDMVERKFAKNSCSVERFDLLDTVEDMYQFLKNRG